MSVSPETLEPLLHAEGVRPAPGRFRAIDTLDIACERRSLTVITGANAIETSFWLETLAAFHPLSTGRLRILGHSSEEISGDPALRRQIGYVDAGAPLLSTFDVRMNVALPRTYHLRETQAAATRVAETWLDRLDYEGPRDVLPARLDRFEKLQVLLARALALDPSLVFFDEPFDMDSVLAWQPLARHIRALAEDGRGVVVATRNMHFAAEHGDRIIHVSEGCVHVHGNWEEFTAAPHSMAFLERLPFNPGTRAP